MDNEASFELDNVCEERSCAVTLWRSSIPKPCTSFVRSSVNVYHSHLQYITLVTRLKPRTHYYLYKGLDIRIMGSLFRRVDEKFVQFFRFFLHFELKRHDVWKHYMYPRLWRTYSPLSAFKRRSSIEPKWDYHFKRDSLNKIKILNSRLKVRKLSVCITS